MPNKRVNNICYIVNSDLINCDTNNLYISMKWNQNEINIPVHFIVKKEIFFRLLSVQVPPRHRHRRALSQAIHLS